MEAFSIKLDVRELKVEVTAGVWIWLRSRWGCVCVWREQSLGASEPLVGWGGPAWETAGAPSAAPSPGNQVERTFPEGMSSCVRCYRKVKYLRWES